ncbi:MAG: hypothetical protein ACYTGG_12545 [Planctomycetota bacterium]|jgi:hypothetical protein
MRILHVIPQCPDFGGRTIIGGHSSCLLALAPAQAEAGEAHHEPAPVTVESGRGRATAVRVSGGREGALHSWSANSAVEPDEGQMGRVSQSR